MNKFLYSILFILIASVIFAQSVWLNEILYDTPGTDNGTFLELKGIPGKSLDGFTVYGINGNGGAVYNVISLTGYSIPADSYFVITDDTTIITEYDMLSSLVDFQNGPDNIILDSSLIVVDAVGYGDFDTEVFAGLGIATYDVYACPLIRVGMNYVNYYDYIGAGLPTPGYANQGTLIMDIDSIQYSWGDSPVLDSIVLTRGMVTAVFPDDSLYYIQAGTGEWKGIEIRDGRADSVAIGDSVACWGLVDEFYSKTRIDYTMSFTQSTGHTPVSTQIAINAVGENYEGQLITIEKVISINDSLGNGEWLIMDQNGDTLMCDDRSGYTLPALGTKIASITGVLDYTYGDYKLQPRSQSDIVEGYDIGGTVGLSDNPADSSNTLVTIVELAVNDSTDASGLYSFEFIPSGIYTFIFTHTGYVSDTIIDTITGNATINTTLNVFIPAYNITGTVGLSDNPADSSGTVISIPALAVSDTTDVHGYYEFLGLNTGIYTLLYSRTGYKGDTIVDTLDADHVIDVTLISLAGIEDNALVYPLISELEYSGNSIVFNLGKNTSGNTDISLIDMSGRIVDRISLTEQPGLYRIHMNNALTNGAYFLNINSDNNSISRKIVILR